MTTAVTPLLGQWRAQAVPAVKPQTDCWVSVRPLHHKAVLPSHCSTQTTQLIVLILMFATCFLLLKLCQWRHPFPKPEFLRFQTFHVCITFSYPKKSNKWKKANKTKHTKPKPQKTTHRGAFKIAWASQALFLLYNTMHNVFLSRGNNSAEFPLSCPHTGCSRAGTLSRRHNSAGIANQTAGLFCKLPSWFLTIKYHLNKDTPLLEKERRK